MRKLLIIFLLAIGYWLLPVLPAQAQFDPNTGIYTDIKGDEIASISWIQTLFGSILTIALRLVGIAAFAMLLVGGFKILTSGGNPDNMEAGKQTLTYAIIGLAVAALGYFIIQFISTFTGVTGIETFSIPTPNP